MATNYFQSPYHLHSGITYFYKHPIHTILSIRKIFYANLIGEERLVAGLGIKIRIPVLHVIVRCSTTELDNIHSPHIL